LSLGDGLTWDDGLSSPWTKLSAILITQYSIIEQVRIQDLGLFRIFPKKSTAAMQSPLGSHALIERVSPDDAIAQALVAVRIDPQMAD
jgi:hypothetical protein